ncbi:glycoside hydrolase family 88 protein [Arsukibacterium indicum]|uniref:Glycoside hydrolase family 88 protein n=1 Tax=Arsukibacterium indicum TaxID=2848612 RepID=A0ABS6MMF7_9GAMM|nr:glycoside hydrolase family 88 protein [Arsukibacterium indicum]MBV2129482.1 glycoside hydrolase family 88 protein [Arsukibacterium indicum]
MNKYLRYSLATVSLAILAGCNPATPPTQQQIDADAGSNTSRSIASLKVANPSTFERTETLYLPFADLGVTAAEAQTLVAKVAGEIIPSQLIDRTGDGKNDTLFLPLVLAGTTAQSLTIEHNPTLFATSQWPAQTQAEISHKVGGQWQDAKYIGGTFQNVTELTPPAQYTDHSEWIRYEGPGIESDKVGYRIYLDWRNGFDIFGKQTAELVLQNVGQDGYQSYHELADWGMDILKVGKSLGAGGFGYWDDKQVQLVSEVSGHTAKVIENGPLYSALQIQYQNWQIAGKTVNLTADLSMTAGSRLVNTRLTLSEPLDNMAIGLVKLPDTKVLQGNLDITGHAWTYLATWGNQSLSAPDSKLGMAVLFKRGQLLNQTEDNNSHVAVMRPAGNELEYYFLAAWDGEPGGIGSEAEFVRYLQQQAEQLTLTPRQSLKTALGQQQKSGPLTAEVALNWSERLAQSEMTRQTPFYAYGGWDYERQRPSKWEYTTGLQLQAYDDLLQLRPNPEWQQVLTDVIGSFITEDGDIRTYNISNYNIDSLNTGNMLLREYQRNQQPHYKKALELLRRQLAEHPRTSEGAFWHKKIYPHQLWLDGVYMGMPFLASYSSAFEDGHAFAEVVKEFTVSRDKLRDPATGLYYHAWDEAREQNWADKETGLASQFWGRGLGWLAMALVDVLEIIPEQQTALRQPLLDMTAELAEALVKVQDADSGVWYQILDKPNAAGNYSESSASSMITYFFAKGVNNGYLDSRYRATALKAYRGLLDEFILVHPDNSISLVNTVQVAGLGFGRDGSYHYYMSEPVFRNDAKANGPFIMAGVQIAKLLSSEKE